MEIVKCGNYKEFKEKLDNELQKATEGFVRIGYLLKLAKDTDILRDSGYANVNEFAAAEYGLDKTKVSRFININDRFSEGGYSEQLQEQYRGFGHAKLTIMLQLPDEVNEEITADFSKSEIQAIKEEVDLEKTVTDIEVMLEEKDNTVEKLESNMAKAVYQYCKEHPENYIKLYEAVMDTEYDGTNEHVVNKIMAVLAPADMAAIMVRIPGMGRYMISIKGKEQRIKLISIRNEDEKEEYDWDEVIDCIEAISPEGDAQKSWEAVYKESFPETNVAPVQQEKPVQKKQTKVTKAVPPKKKMEKVQTVKENACKATEGNNAELATESLNPEPGLEPENYVEPIMEENTGSCTGATEEQVQGQKAIEDYPEYLPEGTKSNMEVWQEIKAQVKTRMESITKAIEEDNYTLIKWDSKKLAELMEAIR